MGVRRNAAVYAGLVGSLALGAPAPAAALSLTDAIAALDRAFVSPSVAFAAGLAGGALLTGIVVGFAALVSRRRARCTAEASQDQTDPTAASEPLVVQEAAGEEPSGYRPRHLRVDAPVAAEKDEAPAVSEPAPSHAASDYEDIAENYARRATFRARMARRAEGVAATLRERLGSNMMDGVPVIERADGSVGDVGTAWWKRAVGEQTIIADSGFADDSDALAIPSDFTGASAALLAPAPRAGGISMRVARIDEGAYPERRTVDDLNQSDEWDLALRSLDERIAIESASQIPTPFVDLVGGVDTLDEPDNLELQTSFIPFKTPAGHPEVVDTESYVDYLIEDEFAKSSSPVARRSYNRFLRVLEGGTSSSKRLDLDNEEASEHVAKHFAVPMAAQG